MKRKKTFLFSTKFLSIHNITDLELLRQRTDTLIIPATKNSRNEIPGTQRDFRNVLFYAVLFFHAKI